MFSQYRTFKKDLAASLTIGLVICLLAWTVGFRILQLAHAASLTNVSDTLSDARPGYPANHTIVFTNPSSTTAGQSITYTFDPNTSAFGSVTSTVLRECHIDRHDIVVATCAGAINTASMATTSYNVLTFTRVQHDLFGDDIPQDPGQYDHEPDEHRFIHHPHRRHAGKFR